MFLYRHSTNILFRQVKHVNGIVALVFLIIGGLPFAATQAQNVATNQLLMQMIAIAGDNGGTGRTEEIDALKYQIEASIKPVPGDQAAAIKANDQGL